MTADRNPYVILGVPFGADREEATRAFARRAKGRRRSASGNANLTDLTWSLNQVQDILKDPRTALHVYRVPANPSALEAQGDGVLRPGPVRLGRRTGPSDEAWCSLLDDARAEAIAVAQSLVATTNPLPRR